jgi:hypothetical protein
VPRPASPAPVPHPDRGRGPLELASEDVALEGANTSFEVAAVTLPLALLLVAGAGASSGSAATAFGGGPTAFATADIPAAYLVAYMDAPRTCLGGSPSSWLFHGLTRSVHVQHGLAADAPVQQRIDRGACLAP